MPHGVYVPLVGHFPCLWKRKREVLRQAAVLGSEGGTGEHGSVWSLLTHKFTQLQVSVIAETK